MNKHNIHLTSVGIDIGTTTTQLIISKLTLSNVMPGSQVPKIEVSDKQVKYRSQIYFTPFFDRQHVDGAALGNIIAAEYRQAGVSLSDIDIGAMIITGETAKKDNAAEIIHFLSNYAGDFVVAVAGPDLESIIAGKGSGAEAMSKRLHKTIVNVDIGGGTTNMAIFASGRLLGSACVNVGGRLFEVDPINRRVIYQAPAAQKVVDRLKAEGKAFDCTTAAGELTMIEETLQAMVGCLDRIILGEAPTPLDRDLVVTNNLPKVTIDAVVFSGGVARYIYGPDLAEWWIHQDVGPLLAKACRQGRVYTECQVLEGTETINATVLGAGAHTVNVSGSTVSIAEESLPLRNVPAIYPEVRQEIDGGIYYTWHRLADIYTESQYKTVALVIPPLPNTSFKTVTRLAENIAAELDLIGGSPQVIVAQQDIAKVLGQTLMRVMGDQVPLVCLDGISVNMGDFLDIAKPLPVQEAVPVIVKTLVFVQN